ncbi:hypothetical protein MKY30_24005 [Oceanobacillus sp. FSL W8-0428]|uniref:hypothetical protein n=1 Tax=Oceanobacillus sp. FSL W8-0428 TaxID=2921715 RepID=UPI0030FAD02F
MNLDEAIEMSKKIEEAYEEGWISFYHGVSDRIQLSKDLFDELAKEREVVVKDHPYADAQYSFVYDDCEFIALPDEEDESNE